ncbi:type I restriction endonuclease subunit R [Almyronema epifaneia]|uniref:Type I restriction endonuclease subunit R n=1 Tax=Almyronema epifaneia S1 TaxID=2991925 RepID=A0ABW6IET7_9CYAN
MQRNVDPNFFPEWQRDLPQLTEADNAAIATLWRRLSYHRAAGNLLEGAVMLLVASPLLEAAGFYDPPFRMQAETSIELAVDDGEEVLRGHIDVLILQTQFWVLVLESKKTTISLRSALPQVLAYMMASPDKPTDLLFGCLTNGDDILLIKLVSQPTPQYALSRVFSLYTVVAEVAIALQILKQMAQFTSRLVKS